MHRQLTSCSKGVTTTHCGPQITFSEEDFMGQDLDHDDPMVVTLNIRKVGKNESCHVASLEGSLKNPHSKDRNEG